MIGRQIQTNLLAVLLFLATAFSGAYAQSGTTIGVEAQLYPTGFISGLQLNWPVGAHWAIQGRVGYNLVRHRDLGEQDDERGGGFGGTLGLHRYLGRQARWQVGVRTDVWFNRIDWKNKIEEPDEEKGETKVTVLQPTLDVSYAFPIGEGLWQIRPKVSLGAEINVRTEGEEVGQGAILLIGVVLARRIGGRE